MKLTSERDDVLPDGRAPKNIRKFLRDFGGTNPYGESNYRLVRAEHVLIHLGNNWTDWPDDTPIEEQGGITFSDESVLVPITTKIKKSGHILKQLVEMPAEMLVAQSKPLRQVAEMRWVHRYPGLTGWMLQHWDPAALYGSRTWWEAQTVPNHPDLQILGPYPERGRYEQTCAWTTVNDGKVEVHTVLLRELPSCAKLEEAIEDRERKRQEHRDIANQGWVRLIAINERMQIEQQEAKKRREYVTQFCRDKVKPMFGSSLGAGRIRAEMAKRAGMSSHVGN